MSIMGKIFGQNASGENGLSIFSRHAASGLKHEFTRSKPWEMAFVAGLGMVAGSLLGAAVAAGIMYAQEGKVTNIDTASQEELTHTAPGVTPGAAAGAGAMLYYFFMHEGLAYALQETRKQVKPQQPQPKP